LDFFVAIELELGEARPRLDRLRRSVCPRHGAARFEQRVFVLVAEPLDALDETSHALTDLGLQRLQ
jgi:hypothetical protein